MSTPNIIVHKHPLLYLRAFTTHWPKEQEYMVDLEFIRKYFSLDISAPVSTPLNIKTTVRDLLRYGGFKPSGRNKPACEYLESAVNKGWFSPHKGINAAVDCCNVVSLHSRLPISVLDLDKCTPHYSIQICPEQTSYPFNASGQVLKTDGLIAFFDQNGPCGSPVKDAERTKTDSSTQKTLSIVWGHIDLSTHVDESTKWYLSLLKDLGCTVSPVNLTHQEA